MAEKKEKQYVIDNARLMAEWNSEKNIDISPSQLTLGSNKKVWWRCSKGHEYMTAVASRGAGCGCPYCAGRKVLAGYNDLQTIIPTLAEEWDYIKNEGLTPKDVTPHSDKKVWWRCRKGHEWQSTVGHRSYGRGCPVCSADRNTSFPEYAFYYYLSKYGLEVIHSYKEKGYELDIYIPAKRTAIEYDGYYWHKNKVAKDLAKNKRCEKDGIKLYRIREALPSLNSSSIDFVVLSNQSDLSETIKKVLTEIIENEVDIDVQRDAIAIESLRELSEKEESLPRSKPEISRQWNSEKNGELRVESFSLNSHKKVWWKCDKGHEWQAVIKSRSNGAGCPYCSGRCAVAGKSDLQTVNPSLASEWNYKKNGNLTPKIVTANSSRRVWWICGKGHEWQATIASRNGRRGCPFCSGKKVLIGFNDLQTINPFLTEEWNYEKNGNRRPENFTSGSGTKVWWRCRKGHAWQAAIVDRTTGHGCPYCTKKYVTVGENDLCTGNPALAKEWNYEKNGSLKPENFTTCSGAKVWWKCDLGHEWSTAIAHRNNGRGCPYCAGKKVLIGYNDLRTINPALATEWNYEKNGDLKPEHFTANSGKKVWWKCSKGHEWQATIVNRSRGSACSICRRKRRKSNDIL